MLIIGVSGGIGTALLQLGKVANLTMYGITSKSKHGIVTEYGATPIDYHTQDFVEVIRKAEPEGLDAVIDGMMRMDYIRGSLSLLRRAGTLVSHGEPAGSPATSFWCRRNCLRQVYRPVRRQVLQVRRADRRGSDFHRDQLA